MSVCTYAEILYIYIYIWTYRILGVSPCVPSCVCTRHTTQFIRACVPNIVFLAERRVKILCTTPTRARTAWSRVKQSRISSVRPQIYKTNTHILTRMKTTSFGNAIYIVESACTHTRCPYPHSRKNMHFQRRLLAVTFGRCFLVYYTSWTQVRRLTSWECIYKIYKHTW